MAARLFHKAVYLAQAKTSALPFGLGREKGIKSRFAALLVAP